jgi:hypothetical protein
MAPAIPVISPLGAALVGGAGVLGAKTLKESMKKPRIPPPPPPMSFNKPSAASERERMLGINKKGRRSTILTGEIGSAPLSRPQALGG